MKGILSSSPAGVEEIREAEAEAEAVAARVKGEAEVERAAADPLAKYRRTYTEDQIAANRVKVLKSSWGLLVKNDRKEVGEAIYAAAEKGGEFELLNIVEPWFAHTVLNDYSGGDGGNLTPLMTAYKYGHIECVRVLVAQPGIELNKGHRDYQSTVLLYASWNGHVDIVELLCSLPGIDCNKADTNGYAPHSHACSVYFGPDKEEKTRKIRAILEAKGAKSR